MTPLTPLPDNRVSLRSSLYLTPRCVTLDDLNKAYDQGLAKGPLPNLFVRGPVRYWQYRLTCLLVKLGFKKPGGKPVIEGFTYSPRSKGNLFNP